MRSRGRALQPGPRPRSIPIGQPVGLVRKWWYRVKPIASAAAIIHGRSDSTINRGGIRIGTAEIHRAVLDSEEITDALVVDLPKEGSGECLWE